jgi:hypothetical protein
MLHSVGQSVITRASSVICLVSGFRRECPERQWHADTGELGHEPVPVAQHLVNVFCQTPSLQGQRYATNSVSTGAGRSLPSEIRI